MRPELYNLLSEEVPYTFPQHRSILSQAGCVGVLRADADPKTGAFVSSWEDFAPFLHTLSFRTEFQTVLRHLKLDPAYDCPLKDADALRSFCARNPGYLLPQGSGYGIRADSEKYAFLIRIEPADHPASFTLYAYRKDWLDQHLERAREGIRFLDPAYRELFRIPDGGRVLISGPNGQTRIETCRYLDAYHLEAGDQIYHICEFADKMEKLGRRVSPLGIEPVKSHRKEERHAGIDR